MFGWIKRKGAKPSPQREQRPDADVNGRAILPELLGFDHSEGATDAQKMMALRWAASWCGYRGEVTEAWLHGLANTLRGIREKGVRKGEFEEEKRVLQTATRALRWEAQRARAETTKSAFPWAQFRLGPADITDPLDCPCKLALTMDKQIMPWSAFPVLPMPGCDAHTCKCWFRQVTKAEAAKSGINA